MQFYEITPFLVRDMALNIQIAGVPVNCSCDSYVIIHIYRYASLYILARVLCMYVASNLHMGVCSLYVIGMQNNSFSMQMAGSQDLAWHKSSNKWAGIV